jgi:hypothetical protein
MMDKATSEAWRSDAVSNFHHLQEKLKLSGYVISSSNMRRRMQKAEQISREKQTATL